MKKLVNTVILGAISMGLMACTSNSGISSLDKSTIKNEVILANNNLDKDKNLVFNYEKSRFQFNQNTVYVYTSARHIVNKKLMEGTGPSIGKEVNLSNLYLQVWKKNNNQWNLTKTIIDRKFLGNEPAMVHDDS